MSTQARDCVFPQSRSRNPATRQLQPARPTTWLYREGRRIYSNVRRFLLFGISGGAAEIMVMLAGPFLGMALPLLPAQILWINLLTHGLTGVGARC